MKARVPMDCECGDYLTKGKIYDVFPVPGGGVRVRGIIDDEGEVTYILINGCPHLRGKAWEIVDETEELTQ